MLESMAAVAGRRVAVVGAGMAGLAVARLLAPHCEVTVVEQRPDLRELSRQANEFSRDSRRSIGVILSQRGARAMEQAGLSLAEIGTHTSFAASHCPAPRRVICAHSGQMQVDNVCTGVRCMQATVRVPSWPGASPNGASSPLIAR